MSATGTAFAGSCAALGWKSAVVLAAPPVFDNIVLELRTEASRCVEIFNGLLPLSHPQKHAKAIWVELRVTVLAQVLLLEEFQRAGCQVIFVHRPIGEDPSDQLLLQIQGAIAEYERALLGERFRRSKLQKARSGQYLSSRAPYGYRYVPKQEGAPGHLVIDETEADLVRTMYSWLIDERMTIRQILKRLNFGPHLPRCGRLPWSASTVHHILADPIYSGTAYSNRYRYVPPKRPRRTRGPHTAEASCRQPPAVSFVD